MMHASILKSFLVYNSQINYYLSVLKIVHLSDLLIKLVFVRDQRAVVETAVFIAPACKLSLYRSLVHCTLVFVYSTTFYVHTLRAKKKYEHNSQPLTYF